MLYVSQAEPTNVRAATRAATCHLKMGQLSEATQILDTVKATVTAAGQAPPPELVSKQNDLDTTKRLVSQVLLVIQVMVILVTAITQEVSLEVTTPVIIVVIIFTGFLAMVRSW